MGEPILQLGNPDNWQQVYEASFNAAPAPNGRYYPINPVVMPVLLSSPIVALAAFSLDAAPRWRLGYWARQYIVTNGFGAIEGATQKAFLNRFMIARYRMLAPQYQLRLEIPYWLRSIDITIWEYSSTVGDSTEALITEQAELTRVDLLRIESKISQL